MTSPNTDITTQNSMGTDATAAEPLLHAPVTSILMRSALPIILGLLVSGVHTFIDAIFISRAVGVFAIGGVSATFPLQMFMISASAMLGSGMASIISRKLGAQQVRVAQRVFSSSLLFAGTVGLLLSVVLIIIQGKIFSLMLIPVELLPYANDYLTPILAMGAISFSLATISECFRAEGKMAQVMIIMSLSSALNIVLDALFLFVFEWGVAGAAWATVLSVFFSLSLALYFLSNGKNRVVFRLQYCRYNWHIHKEAVLVGLPVLLSYAGFAFAIAVVNYFLARFAGPEADLLISANGILNRTFMLLFLPLLGLMIAFQTLAGFNYGAQQYSRVKRALLVAIAASTVYCLLLSGQMIFMPTLFLSLFTDDSRLLEAAVRISSILFIGFTTVGAVTMSVAVFQAMGKVIPAMILNALHSYVLLIPGLVIFTHLWGVEGVWWTFPILDFTVATTVFAYTYWYFRRTIT